MDGVLDDLMSKEIREQHRKIDPSVDLLANYFTIYLRTINGFFRDAGEGNNPEDGPTCGYGDGEVREEDDSAVFLDSRRGCD